MQVQRELVSRDAHPRLLAGEPVTTDEHWVEGLNEIETLVRLGAMDQATTLLLLLDALPNEDGDRIIATSGHFEARGDAVVRSNVEAARWFYNQAHLRFRNWISSSSSGGEGTARSSVRDSALGKLMKLRQ